MTGSDTSGKKPNKPKKTNARDARLAAALRENLRRRKAQERARDAGPQPKSAGAPGRPPQSDENR